MRHLLKAVLMTLLIFAVCTVGMAKDSNTLRITETVATDGYTATVLDYGTVTPEEFAALDIDYSRYATVVGNIVSPWSACDDAIDCINAIYLTCQAHDEKVDVVFFSLADGTCTGQCESKLPRNVIVECVSRPQPGR